MEYWYKIIPKILADHVTANTPHSGNIYHAQASTYQDQALELA